MTVQRKQNIAGYTDSLGRFRPIRSPQFVGSPERKATRRVKSQYSRAKAGDLGKRRQERALEDVFDREIRLMNEAEEAKRRDRERLERSIEKDVYGEADERSKGKTLAQFVRASGGIRVTKGDRGELEYLSQKESGRRGLIAKRGGKSLDGMFQAARESGYNVQSMDDLIDRLVAEAKGGKPMYKTHGYLDYRQNPSELRVMQITPKTYGVFLRKYLLKRFRTKAAAETYAASIRARVKKNPATAAKLAKAAIAIFDTDLDLDLDTRDVRRLGVGAKRLRGKKVNPPYAAAMFGIPKGGNSEVLIYETPDMAKPLTVNQKAELRSLASGEGFTKIRFTEVDLGRAPDFAGAVRRSKKNPAVIAWKVRATDSRFLNRYGRPSSYGEILVSAASQKAALAKGRNLWIKQLMGMGRFDPKAITIAIVKTNRAKKNPKAKDPIREQFAKYLKIRGFDGYAKDVRNGADLIKVIKQIYGWEPPAFQAKLRQLEASLRKKNPIDPVGLFANAAVGIASALQIKEYMNRPKRKTPARRNNGGTIPAKRRKAAINPAKRTPKAKTNPRSARKVGTARSAAGPKGHFLMPFIDGVYLTDGESLGRKFKTQKAAREYAQKMKIRLVNPPATVGLPSRPAGGKKAVGISANPKGHYKFKRGDRVTATNGPHKGKTFTVHQGSYSLNKPVYTMQEVVVTRGVKSAWQFPESGLRKVRKPNPKTSRSAGGKKAVRISANPKTPQWLRERKREAKARIAKLAKEHKTTQANILLALKMSASGRMSIERAIQIVTDRKANPRSAGVKKAVGISANPKTKDAAYYVVGGTNRIVASFSTLAAAKEYAKLHPAYRVLTRRQLLVRNPHSKPNPKTTARRRTFEMFQGRPASMVRPLPVSRFAPARMDQLGDLIEIKLADGQLIKPNPKRFKLCAAGGKLWIAGGTFAKPNPAGRANELNPVEKIVHVVYGTRKPHHGDHKYTQYIHRLGEDSGHLPTLAVDREGFPIIRGGKYKIEARGIVN